MWRRRSVTIGIRPTGLQETLANSFARAVVIIDTALSGRDRSVVAPTGGGNLRYQPRVVAGRIDRRRFAPIFVDERPVEQLMANGGGGVPELTVPRAAALEVMAGPHRQIRLPYIAPERLPDAGQLS